MVTVYKHLNYCIENFRIHWHYRSILGIKVPFGYCNESSKVIKLQFDHSKELLNAWKKGNTFLFTELYKIVNIIEKCHRKFRSTDVLSVNFLYIKHSIQYGGVFSNRKIIQNIRRKGQNEINSLLNNYHKMQFLIGI